MKSTLITKKNMLIAISLLANVALLFVCTTLYSMSRSFYTDYRHFRALGVGTSESTLLETSDAATGITRVVLYGDSRVQNWVPSPVVDNTSFINAGINGETTTEMRRRIEHDVLRHNPDIVVIQAGANDLTASVTRGMQNPQKLLDDMHLNMEYFITTLTENDIEVVVTSVFPNNTVNFAKRFFWFDTLASEIENTNHTFQQLAQNPNVHWLDLSDQLYTAAGKADSSLYIDTLHLNKTGYRKINTQLKDLLNNLAQDKR